jgi:hypothetical protein
LPRPGFFPRPSSSPPSALRLGSEFNHSSHSPSQPLLSRVVSLSGSAPGPTASRGLPSPHRPTPATSPPPPSVTSPPPSPVTSPRTRRMGSVSPLPLRRPPLSRLPPFQSSRACLSIQDHAVPPPRPPMRLLGPWVTREAIGVPSRPPDSGSPPQSAS